MIEGMIEHTYMKRQLNLVQELPLGSVSGSEHDRPWEKIQYSISEIQAGCPELH